MADVELPDLPAAVSIADSDLLHIRQGPEDKKSTVAILETHLDGKYLRQSDNLASLTNVATARTNLGVQSTSEASATFLEELNNLSDLTNVPSARNNLGLGTLAVLNEGIGGTNFRNNTDSDARYLLESNNLSDLTSVVTARTNLGLGTAAVVNTGTGASNVPTTSEADARYLLEANNLNDVNNAATAFANIKQGATTTSTGVVEKATNPEVEAGTVDRYPDAAGVTYGIEHHTDQKYGVTGYATGVASFSGNSFLFNSPSEPSPQDIEFSTDGLTMFMLGDGLNAVLQYTLTTAFDVTTATYSGNSLNIAAQESIPRGMTISPNGLRLFIVGDVSDTVYQYNLISAFDLSTASYSGLSFTVSGQESNARAVDFSQDGSTMFITGTSSQMVHQYSLSTGFDLSTASTTGVLFSVASEEANPQGLKFSQDGLKMFIVGLSEDSVFQYDLKDPFNVSVASYSGLSFYVGAQEENPNGLTFSSGGLKMFITGGSSDAVSQYHSNSVYLK